MSVERQIYESDWHECRRCHCRRPDRELLRANGGFVCRDQAWCDKVVLWREEAAEVREQTAQGQTRRKGKRAR